jgi:hypothetical protein
MIVSLAPDLPEPGTPVLQLPAPGPLEAVAPALVLPAPRPPAPEPPEQLPDELLPTSMLPTPLPMSIHFPFAPFKVICRICFKKSHNTVYATGSVLTVL